MICRRLAFLALAVMATIGCRSSEDDDTVVLWHSYAGDERAALEQVVASVTAASPNLRVELVAVPYDAFADKITNAIPNGNGPDLFIFAHDRLGDWVATSVVEPIEFYVDEATADRFAYDAVSALAYEGSLFGLPVATKSVAMFYRKDIVASPPTTTDDLADVKGRLVYDNTDLYFHAPWLHGFGGRLFTPEGELDIASPESIAALRYTRSLTRRGIVPTGVTTTMVASLFNQGRVGLAISGPWFIGDIQDGVPWAIAPLPIVSETGQRLRPFLGVEGVMMSSRARDKKAAFAIMNAITSDASAIARARKARQVVPNLAAYDEPDIGGDPVLSAFRRQLDHTEPMPATPAMRMVWTPYKTALQRVLGAGDDPGDALRDAEREIKGYIQGAKPR